MNYTINVNANLDGILSLASDVRVLRQDTEADCYVQGSTNISAILQYYEAATDIWYELQFVGL